MSLSEPRDLATPLVKVFLAIGLSLPIVTGIVSILFAQLGLMGRVPIYPWDDILSALFFLTLFITPESICAWLFHSQIIKKFMARMGYAVIVVFLYADYIFLPAGVYAVFPEVVATLIWVAWPPLVALALGFLVGRIESKRLLTAGY